MDIDQEATIKNEFAIDTITGLLSNPKYLSSKYFYNQEGSKIFQDIMRMPEYYLTDCELEIFSDLKQEILDSFSKDNESFELIELGAGDGTKTKILLSHFLNRNAKFKYSPIDISKDAVIALLEELKSELPKLKVNGLIGDYFNLIGDIKPNGYLKKIILFLGSNIGNYNDSKSLDFLEGLRNVMSANDLLFIGFDMKKDPRVILDAYNDPHGHTAAFNLNLLQRINDEMGADFDISKFFHKEEYNPDTGTASSYIVSKANQSVAIIDHDLVISFEKDERIFTEISQKYSHSMINELAMKSGFEVVKNFIDKRQYFVNSLWKIKP